MKILFLKNSILFLRIRPELDDVKCLFLFFVTWNCFLVERQNFNLEILNVSQVKEFYKIAANDYTKKYKL